MKKQEKKQDVTERINSIEDALNETGRPIVPEFADVPIDLREYFQNQYKAIVLAEALNEGEKLDWTDGNQEKWLPWYRLSSGVFVFYVTRYYDSDARAGGGSRLCLVNDKVATHAGKKFPEVYTGILLK